MLELVDTSHKLEQFLKKIQEEAGIEVLEWVRPLDFETPQASFVNRHIIIAGQKDRK